MISILAQQAAQSPSAWLPVVLLIIIGVGFAAGNLILSIWVGPHRTGSVKETTYESGMMPIGDARRRFNVRFYIVAMIFLVFDVEIVFFYPWATLFPHELVTHTPLGLQLLIEAIIFVGLLLVAYFYAWGKGVFRWD